jgi:hypothetical protein
MGKYTGLEALLTMTDILTNPKRNIVSNIKDNKHANMSLEADGDSSDSADPMGGGGGEDQGMGDALNFDEGLGDMGGGGDEEGGGDPFGGDMGMGGDTGDSSGGGMGGDGESGFKPIDQETKDVDKDPHYVQNRRIVLFDMFMDLKDSVNDSKERLSENNQSFTKNKPIIESLEELEKMVTLYIESINKVPHDQSMYNLSKCQALYNHINEKV